ncbi:BTB/POZ domain-containing protein [Aspergillus lucknowensis]|uniref:BTB domain-containing protein n=1 Tax=Aspergillus lucknowensis TaxID=176173 RepID=A0ABR4LL61_9EURO
MSSLENKIKAALNNPESLKALIPEIKASESPEPYIRDILVGTAEDKYTETFEILKPLIYPKPKAFRKYVAKVLRRAIEMGETRLAQETLAEIKLMRPGNRRTNLLQFALEVAGEANDTDVAEIVLKEDLATQLLETSLRNACEADNIEIARLIHADMMRDKPHELNTLAAEFGEPELEAGAKVALSFTRARILEKCLDICLKNQHWELCGLLVPSYLKTLTHLHEHDIEDGPKGPKRNLDVPMFSFVAEDTCWDLLAGYYIPGPIKCVLLEHILANIPTDVQVWADGECFDAHKRVLAYWSPYFAAMFQGEWADSEEPDFGSSFGADTLHRVLGYMYSSYWDDPQTEDRAQIFEELYDAADYLGIEALKAEVGAMIRSDEEMGDSDEDYVGSDREMEDTEVELEGAVDEEKDEEPGEEPEEESDEEMDDSDESRDEDSEESDDEIERGE